MCVDALVFALAFVFAWTHVHQMPALCGTAASCALVAVWRVADTRRMVYSACAGLAVACGAVILWAFWSREHPSACVMDKLACFAWSVCVVAVCAGML